jgi:hypothetical protein
MFWFLRRLFHGGRFGMLWCSFLHNYSPMWPIRDHYESRTCGRQHRVPWAEPERTGAPLIRQPLLPSLGSTLVPELLLRAVSGAPSLRGQSIAPDSSATAAVEHFVASQEHPCRSGRKLAARTRFAYSLQVGERALARAQDLEGNAYGTVNTARQTP